MSKLQQALSQVQPPKVNPQYALQGAQYRGATQQAENVRQDNPFSTVNQIIQSTGQLIEHREQIKVNEAEKLYRHAVDNGLDPLELAAQKAEQESGNVIDWALETALQGGDRDPLFYQRSINANKKAEQAGFDIDTQLEIDIANGTIKSHKDLMERRSSLRDKAFTEIAEETGVERGNRYFYQGAQKNNDASLFALNQKWARTEEAAIQVDNQRRLMSGLSDLKKQGANNSQAYAAYFDKARAEGIIRNDSEMWGAMQAAINQAVDSGDSPLINGLMDYKMNVRGEEITFGDALGVEARGEIFAKAEANLINNNEKLFDEYHDLKSNVMLLSQSGNGNAALTKIGEIRAWLDRHQPSDRVTPQRRELAQLEQSVKSHQLALNMQIRKENAKKAEKLEEEAAAWELMSANSMGQTVDFSAVDSKAYDRVGTKRLQAINNSNLSPEERNHAYAQLVSMLPKGSNVTDALQSQFSRGLADAEMAVVTAQNGKGDLKIPAQVESFLQLHNANQLLAKSVMKPDEYQRLSVLAEKVKRGGWGQVVSPVANSVFPDKRTEDMFNNDVNQRAYEMGLNPAQTEAFRMEARIEATTPRPNWFSADSPNMTQGLNVATNKWKKQRVEIGTGMNIDRDDLAAFSNKDTIPVVENVLKQKVAQIKQEGKGSGYNFYTLQQLDTGELAVVNVHLGTIAYKATPDDIYRGEMQRVKDEKPDRIDELRGAVNEASMKTQERQKETMGIMEARIYK